MNTITLLDGGLSREMTRFGAVLKQPEWTAGALIETPEAVEKALRAFVDAGADMVTTASYAVVPFHLGWDRFEAEGLALAQRSGELARRAVAGSNASVAGCLPPACGSYIPAQFDPEAAEKILDVLVRGLSPHVDIWLAETMSSLTEIRVTAAAVAGSDKPLWIACSLEDEFTDQPPRLRSGEAVEEAAQLAVDLGAEALLFNCSLPEVMESALTVSRSVLEAANCDIPLGVYANGFAPTPRDGSANETLAQIRDDLGPEAYLEWANAWVAAGATIIGGCCGIGSEHIAELVKLKQS